MSKQVKCGYLYADGHAIVLWEKQDREAGEVEWTEVHERWTEAQCRFDGRIVFHSVAVFNLAKQAKEISAEVPNVTHGSDATKRISQPVGHLSMRMAEGFRQWIYFYDLPGLLGGSYCYQPEVKEVFADVSDKYHWCTDRISKVHRIKAAAVEQSVAA